MRKTLRILRKVLFWIFFVCLFFTTVVTVVLYVYEDDIKQYAIDELNAHLKTNIEVRNIELTVWRSFPYASLQFENVFIKDAYVERQSEDTLLFAENVFFNFNLMDIWRGDYSVRRINASNGQLNLRTTAEGDCNYGIIRDEDDSIERESNFKFMLELFKLNNIDFNYANLSTHQYYDVHINDGLLKGDFTAEEYQLKAEGDLHVNQIKSNSFSLIKNKDANLRLDLHVNRNEKSYTFNTGDLTVEEMPFNVTGRVDSAKIDLQVTGHNVQLQQLANSLVDESLNDARKYQGTGVIDFKSTIKGGFSKTEMPSVSAEFSLMGGSLTEPDSKLKIRDINLVGHYHNEQSDRKEELSFENLSFKLLKSNFLGNAKMTDFEQPELKTSMQGNLDIAAFHQFFKFKNVQKTGGQIKLNMAAVIRFLDPEYRKDKFEILDADGNFTLTDVYYQKEGEDVVYRNINGDVVIRGKDAAVRDFTFSTKSSDVLVNGAIKNFVPYIEGSGGLGLIAAVESDRIDLDEFLVKRNEDPNAPPVMFQLPDDLNLNVELNVKELLWDGHHFEDLSGQLLYTNHKGDLRRFKLKTLEGNVSGNITLSNLLQEGNLIDGNLRFSHINVKSLFAEWDNFKQKAITDKHISGWAAGDVEFLLGFNPYFSLMEDKIYTLSDVKLSNGALDDLETMRAITDYMRSNAGLKLLLNKHIDSFEQKLLHLQFSDLQNQIEVKDRKIHIPKMKIKTNALDLDLFGWHDFDNNVEYHFSFRFRDLKTKPEYTEFGKIEDDGLGIVIYITMTGNLDDPVFALDKEERKNQIKVNLTEEKENIKSILKTEFGLFNKDTTIRRISETNEKEVEFIFYEDDIEAEDTLTKGENKKRTSTFFDRLKKKSKQPDEVIFEIDQ